MNKFFDYIKITLFTTLLVFIILHIVISTYEYFKNIFFLKLEVNWADLILNAENIKYSVSLVVIGAIINMIIQYVHYKKNND